MKTLIIGLLFFTAFANAESTPIDSVTREEETVFDAILSEPFNPDLLVKYDAEVLEKPSSRKRRWQRSLILLKHGEYRETTAEDIDSLLLHPLWKTQGERLKAMYLYLQGRIDEAADLMRQNIRNNVNIVEQTRLLAAIELSRKDTAAALAVYRFAWEQYQGEDVYVELLRAYRGHGKPPEALLKQGTKLFSQNPGVLQTLFDVYYLAGKPADLRKCLEISGRAEKTLWPRSIDWKINHARALLALKKQHGAESVLLEAVDLMDADSRLEGENGALRAQVFKLLETSRK